MSIDYTQKAIDFYKDKESKPEYTTKFIKKYQQESDGPYTYIAFANLMSSNESDEEFIKKGKTEKARDIRKEDVRIKNAIRDALKNKKSEKVYALNKHDDDFYDSALKISVNKDVGEPNQKWHFYVAYCAVKELEDKPANVFRIQCPELWLWLIEAAEDGVNITHEDVVFIYEKAVELEDGKISLKKWNECLYKYKEKLITILRQQG